MRVEQYIDERDSRDAAFWDAEADLYHTGGIACKPDTRRAHKPSTFPDRGRRITSQPGPYSENQLQEPLESGWGRGYSGKKREKIKREQSSLYSRS